ncbi:MAG: serine hydrolase [Eudoraea sp.]|nr:serine hydrolase [Eudoraea sp.]
MIRSTLNIYLIFFISCKFYAQNLNENSNVPYIPTFPISENSSFNYIDSEVVNIPALKLKNLSDELIHWAEDGAFVGGELLILKRGSIIFHEAYGWSDKEKQIPLERNSIWCIKSMTKPYIATAIMLLIEEGKISLDDKIIDFMPEFEGDKRTTIAHLLSHTSGYTGLGDTNGYMDLQSWVNSLVKNKPEKKFGEYSYGDFNFEVLTYLIENVSQVKVEEFLSKRIFAPLKLNESYTHFDPNFSWSKKVNSRYRWVDGHYIKNWTNLSDQSWSFFPGAWGIWSTAVDYAKFLQTFLQDGEFNNTKLLEPSTVREMTSPHGFKDNVPIYGYGWYVKPYNEEPESVFRFGHGGVDGTISYVYPKEELVVLFMTHGRGGDHLDAFRDLLGTSGLVKGNPAVGMIPINESEKNIVNTKATDLSSYIGLFLVKQLRRKDEQLIASVYMENNGLKIKISPLKHSAGMIRDLIYLGGDRFAPGLINNGNPEWINPQMEVEFGFKESDIRTINISAGGNTIIKGYEENPRIIKRLISDTKQLKHIDELLDESLQMKGIEETKSLYRRLYKEKSSNVIFSESMVNFLGYRYLGEKLYSEALALFELNIEAYPNSPNCYDSLADAWKRLGNFEKAKTNYEKALKLAENLNDPMAKGIRERLKIINSQKLNKN